MLYAAKCYWPGVDRAVLERVTARAAKAGAAAVRYRGTLLFAQDDVVLCLFEAPSRAAARRASEEAGIPCERLIESVWLEPDGGGPRAKPWMSHRRRQQ